MTGHASARLCLVAALWATAGLCGATRPLCGQAPGGSLQRLGDPARLLRQPLSSTAGARALEEPERLRWRPAFRGEEIEQGPSRRWLEADWSVRLAAVNDTIYRVSLETYQSDLAAADRLYRALQSLLADEIGDPVQEDCTTFHWWGADGDVLLLMTDAAEGRRTTVVFTSSLIRSLTPL
jgi:hypothetical protein